jgi:hypothetical protein
MFRPGMDVDEFGDQRQLILAIEEFPRCGFLVEPPASKLRKAVPGLEKFLLFLEVSDGMLKERAEAMIIHCPSVRPFDAKRSKGAARGILAI